MTQNFMQVSEVKPPQEVSDRLLGAIQGALAEERVPRRIRILKVGVATMLATLLLTLPIAVTFREQLGWAWKLAALAWAVCFFVGFSLHFHPQPRLTVPGYWTPMVFAKVLIGMTLLTGLQILLCPSFVFLESSFGWSPFEPITELFMAWGGMSACMFACGLIFSSLGALVTFVAVRKVISRSATKDLLRAAGLAFLTQLPVIGVQVVDDGLRPFALHWALGSGFGLLVVIFLVRFSRRLVGSTASSGCGCAH